PYMPLAYVLNIIIFAGLAYLFYVGAKNGFPLLTGVDRFDLSAKIQDPIYTSLRGNRIVAMAYIGFMLATARRPSLYRFMACCVIVVSALLGDKFTEF